MKGTVARAPHLRRPGWAITSASLAAIAFATLLPEPGIPVESHFCLVCGSLGGLNAVLNVLLFVPLGVGLGLLEVRGKRALFLMLTLSVLIEAAQLAVIPGRSSTIGDVLTNALGGALGFAIGGRATLLLRPPPHIARNLTLAWVAVWLTIQAASSFGLALSLPDAQYFGQIAPVLGNFAAFRGQVLVASIGAIQIPSAALADGREVRQRLLEGATFAATVVPAEPPRKTAPVVRLADGGRNEIVLLAQNGGNLIFSIRTGAAALRLRPAVFVLTNAFPQAASRVALADPTLRISGRYRPTDVMMIAQSESDRRDDHIRLAASLGWTFWLPSQWAIEGTRAEQIFSWLWLALLAVPLGYWSFGVNSRPRTGGFPTHLATVSLGAAALLGTGLFLIPQAFGLSGATFGDWLATAGGVVLGYVSGARIQSSSLGQGDVSLSPKR